MAENKTVKEITEKLEKGLKELFDSEKFKTYLKTMSKFHNYSFNNTLLIAMQKPDATFVAGYQAWQKKFDRHVIKGAKGIKIMAPSPYKKKQEVEVKDPDTGKIMMGADGKPWTEEVEVNIPSFRPVTVFDVSTTEGKPLPVIGVDELLADVNGYKDLEKALMKISPVPIDFENIESGAKGYFSPKEQRIAVQKDMSQAQTIKTEIHEICHSLLDDKDNIRIEGVDLSNRDRSTKEVTAEAVAYTVSAHFGIDTSDYSFGYLASWSSGKELSELKESMEIIRKTASKIITDIEHELDSIRLERSDREAVDLAVLVDNFMYDYDIYRYMDEVDDRETQVLEIANDIRTMDASYISAYLKEIVANKEGSEDNLKEAQVLLDKLNEYKPLKMIEELSENNYNMIDDVLNNGFGENTKNEEIKQTELNNTESIKRNKVKTSKRPSLKKRLKEKMVLVVAEPERPAKEKSRELYTITGTGEEGYTLTIT